MIAIYAHGFGATNGLPLPRWLLAYLLAFAVVIAFIVLRFVRPPRRPVSRNRELAGSNPGPASPNPGPAGADTDPVSPATERWSPWFAVSRAAGLALFLGTFVAAALGVDDSAANIAPVTVIVLFFLGMQVVSLAGDVFWSFNPFDTLAALLLRGEEPDREAPSWTAAAFLASFVWFVFAYPEFYPPTPHEVAVFVAVYTVAVLPGAGMWGRSWVRRGEGFGALFGAIATLGREKDAGPGLAPLLVVYLGGIVFDGMSQTNWWIDVLGTSRGWTERALNTVGFAWSIAIVGVVYAGATRTIAALANSEPGETATRFARVLLAVGLALSVAHYLPAFLIDVQNFYALLSDPLGRGWDLFGTIDYAIDNQVLTATQIGVVQSILLGLGCVGAAVIAHDVAFANYRGRVAVRATYPIAILLIAASAGAIWLLLGT